MKRSNLAAGKGRRDETRTWKGKRNMNTEEEKRKSLVQKFPYIWPYLPFLFAFFVARECRNGDEMSYECNWEGSSSLRLFSSASLSAFASHIQMRNYSIHAHRFGSVKPSFSSEQARRQQLRLQHRSGPLLCTDDAAKMPSTCANQHCCAPLLRSASHQENVNSFALLFCAGIPKNRPNLLPSTRYCFPLDSNMKILPFPTSR